MKIAHADCTYSQMRFQGAMTSAVAFAAASSLRAGASMSSSRELHALVGLALLGLKLVAAAQPPGPSPSQRTHSAREAALTDLTGHWVAQVTEDWRWRMITPPKGDYASVPLNALGRQVSDRWDLEADNAAGEQCRAFGAGGIMRQPTRLTIDWIDDDTLQMKTDAGQQTRLFHFDHKAPAEAAPSWQGRSEAEWIGGPPAGQSFGPVLIAPTSEAARARSGPQAGRPPAAPQVSGLPGGAVPGSPAGQPGGAPPSRGSLKVVTTHLRPGYLRKNGVPYSGDAVVTEYYDRLTLFGNEYLQVVTVVTDPTYLTSPFAVSNQFKRERDGSKWHPTSCETDAPVGALQRPQF